MQDIHYYKLTFREIPGGLIVYQDDFKDMDKGILTEGTPIINWPYDVTLYVKGKIPTDYLFSPLSSWFILSNRAQRAIEEANIKGIQILPVHIKHKSGIELPGYAIINVLTVLAALDYEHTSWVTPAREHVSYPQLNILEEALQLRKIKGFDIFRLAEQKTNIYVSQYFKESLERKNATIGLCFIPISIFE